MKVDRSKHKHNSAASIRDNLYVEICYFIVKMLIDLNINITVRFLTATGPM